MVLRRGFFAIVILAILAAGAILLAGAPRAQAGLISRSEEVKMGQDAARQFESQNRTYRDRRVEAIGNRIARVSDRRDIEYSFKVVDRDEVNAVSLPGGYVYVYRGLLRTVGDDDDALAGVIAHEVGHVTERHSAKQVEKAMGANLLLELLTKGKSRTAGAIVASLLSLKFSRSDEYEADEVGVQYMSRAGYDPRGLSRFFRQLEASEGRGGNSVSWLRTHPNSGERARRVDDMAANLRSRGR
jgi:beta-barrel assembly-enhancing protease